MMFEVLLEIAGIQAILFGLYYLFLRKETDFFWRRSYLIGLVLISGTMPFIHLPAPELVQSVNQTVFSSPVLPSASVSATETAGFDWMIVLEGLGILGSLLVFLTMLKSMLEIYKLYRTGTPFSLGNFWVWLHPKVESSFSFFNWIFSKEVHASIIAHEAAHVQLKHSYDVILFQLNRAIFWWNPVSWLLLKELTQVHEYQADQLAIKDKNIDEYQELLINTTLSSMGWGLASSFHSGSLLKRLHAMKQKTKKINRWKISSLGALVAIIALVFACEELDKDIKKMSEDSRQIGFDELPANMQKLYFEGESKFTFMKVYVETDEVDNIEEKLESIKTIDAELIESYSVAYGTEEPQEVIVVLRKDAGSYEYLEQKSKASDEVFTLVDEQPEFPGGMTAFYQYVRENLKYPEAAKRMGIQGRVFVQFIVDKTGNVTDVKAVKGIGAGCDEVAEKVIAASPAFEPGKQRGKPVKVRMVMPIIFSFEPNVAKNVNDAKNTVIETRDDNGEVVDAEIIELSETKPNVDVQVTENENTHFVEQKNNGTEPKVSLTIKQSEEPLQPGELVFADGKEIKEVDPSVAQGEIEAERTAKAGAQLAEAANKLSEVVVVGLSKNTSGSTNVPPPPQRPYEVVGPMYPGGMSALFDFVQSNLKYPKQAKKEGIQGKVYAHFRVKKDGTVDQVRIANGIGAGCDEEAARVVRLLTNWTPKMIDGVPVETQMTLPIEFSL